MSITDLLSFSLTPKEKEVVDDFIKKAEMQGHSAGYNEYVPRNVQIYAISKLLCEN